MKDCLRVLCNQTGDQMEMHLRNRGRGSALIPWLPVLPIQVKPRRDDHSLGPFVVHSPSQGFFCIRLGEVTKHPVSLYQTGRTLVGSCPLWVAPSVEKWESVSSLV